METVERGARVYVSNMRADYFGKTGTVRNLPGDPPDEEYPDGFQSTPDEVWIAFDGGPSAWVEIADLTRL